MQFLHHFTNICTNVSCLHVQLTKRTRRAVSNRFSLLTGLFNSSCFSFMLPNICNHLHICKNLETVKHKCGQMCLFLEGRDWNSRIYARSFCHKGRVLNPCAMNRSSTISICIHIFKSYSMQSCPIAEQQVSHSFQRRTVVFE